MPGMAAWGREDPELVEWMSRHRQSMVKAYDADPMLLTEHSNQEDSYRTGGYSRRQVLELVQNAADALRDGGPGRVEVHLVGDTLYCANEGASFTKEGLHAICHAFLSDKRDDAIGRFGLGFKSVLGITRNPAVFSRSISFDFDAARTAEQLRRTAPTDARFPVLRIPAHLDVLDEMERDPVLAELGEWATTVVRLPLYTDVERIEEDIRTFPVEFLLFVRNVSLLRVVVDRSSRRHAELVHECVDLPDGVRRLRTEGGEHADWKVWQVRHRPSAEAQLEVGEAIRRDTVTVTWAAPLSADVSALGRFWSYYPLSETTSLRGIVNAPWQINDDRTSLLNGRFNEEILERVVQLVVEGLPELRDPEDPARHFDYLPARGREAPNFADRYLTDHVPGLVANSACVPDRDGVLRRVDQLRYPHQEQLRVDQAMLREYHSSPGCPVAVPHIRCHATATRQARLRSLIRADDSLTATVELPPAEWLEQIVPDGTDEQCIAALKVVSVTQDGGARTALRSASVLPDERGRLRALTAVDAVFLHGDVLTRHASIDLVRQSLLDHADAERLLRELGFKDVDAALELARLERVNTKKWSATEWAEFWELVGRVGPSAARHLENHLIGGRALKVRCRDGNWRDSIEVVQAGRVRPVKAAFVLDDEFHGDLRVDVLRRIGVVSAPLASPVMANDMTHREYLRRLRSTMIDRSRVRGRSTEKDFDFVEQLPVGPLYVLRRFQDSGDERSSLQWTRSLLELDVPPKWKFGSLGRNSFPPAEVLAPPLWAAKEYGLLATAWGTREPRRSVAHALQRYAPFLPVAEIPSADKLGLAHELSKIGAELWTEFLRRVPEPGDPWLLGELVGAASACPSLNDEPQRVPALNGRTGCLAPPAELLVARTDDEVRLLEQRRLPYIGVVDESVANHLVEQWGCVAASTRLRLEVVAENQVEPVVALDRYHGFRSVAEGVLDGVELVECTDLFRQITGPDGVDRQPADLLRDGSTVYYRATLNDRELVLELANEFEIAVNNALVDRVLDDSQSAEVAMRIERCRSERDPARKLLHLLDAVKLEARLPTGLLEAVRGHDDTDDVSIARMLLQVDGYDVLRGLRHELAAAGLRVPDMWAGSAPAISFVRSLGFPSEYAGERGAGLEPDVTVFGPSRLGPLHGYQLELVEQIRGLIADRGRGLLFLPTGAGKTRVTVHALAMAFVEDGLGGPLLWIAQSEELCEQAVQTWSTVWRDLGDGRPLRLCRLWSRNEIADSDHDLTVVIATDAKLAECRNEPDYAWLSRPSTVVIDEAHEATGSDYTKTLAWLGLDAHHTERPLLGLTATPFKGTSEDMTRRLAGRFNRNLLDVLGEDPYGRLQHEGVLSRVEHRVLDGGEVALNAKEAELTQRTRLLPPAVLDRLGRDEARTRRLVAHIQELPEDWPVLVFAASVLSAQVLAALLRVGGVEAAAISGSTRVHERRRNIERFRAGEIRVLTNCNVLTQGFDVPGVRALYIARPTFSPNAYIQMVGRGLRGPANGGKSECLVVNVADTFGQFGERLAYKEFDHLWQRQGGTPA
jgi:superfamily II DNA or RNA helicase